MAEFNFTIRINCDAFERALYRAAISILDELIEDLSEWTEEGRHAREVRQAYADSLAALDLISVPQENR